MRRSRAPNARMRILCTAMLFGTAACMQTTNLASSQAGKDAQANDDAGAGEADAADTGQADAAPPITVSDAGVVFCGALPCACSNGSDDDDDNLIDGFDPECTGPYDQDESSFATEEMKGGNPKCGDCFFDGNPGFEDGCRIATRCSVDGTSSGAPGACNSCVPSEQCVSNCLPRTPNGCDCFGCCEIPGAPGPVLLADTCSMKDLGKPGSCPPCKLSSDCMNPCERCELCAGKTPAEVPKDCGAAGGPGYSCEGGRVCSATEPCDLFEYCTQGCCLSFVL